MHEQQLPQKVMWHAKELDTASRASDSPSVSRSSGGELTGVDGVVGMWVS